MELVLLMPETLEVIGRMKYTKQKHDLISFAADKIWKVACPPKKPRMN